MIPLYEDPWFTFRFADDRVIPRFHLQDVAAGRRVRVFKMDPQSGVRLGLLAAASVGDGGWVDLAEPITVRAGDAFIVVPEAAVQSAAAQSLCETCARMREILTPRGSRFLLCELSGANPDYPKYPRQPVLRCEGHQPRESPTK